MPNSTPIVEYINSFPLAWTDNSSPKGTPVKRQQSEQEQPESGSKREQEQERSPPSDRPGQDEVEIAAAADGLTQGLPEAYNIIVRDFAYPKLGNSSQSPTPSTRSHKRRPSAAANFLEVPTARRHAIAALPEPKPPNNTSYSTVYPSSWTLASQPPTPEPTSDDTQEPSHIPPIDHSPTRLHRERIESTTSQGEAILISPLRRRLQKEFWSLSVPRDKPHATGGRSMSLMNSDEMTDLDLVRFGTRAGKYAQTLPRTMAFARDVKDDLAPRLSNFSTAPRLSNFSTAMGAERAFHHSSQGDSPARARNISLAYSNYGV